MVPERLPAKILHHIWFQGIDDVPEPYKTNIEACSSMNPDWKHMIWTDTTLRQECYRFSDECGRIYDQYELMHQKIDLGRYVVVCNHGGISLDADANCVRPLDTIEYPTDNILISLLALMWYERLVWNPVNNATIYSPYPNHPSMRELVQSIVNRGNGEQYEHTFQRIQHTTGPYAFQEIVHLLPNVTFVEGEVFEPCVANNCHSTDKTIVEHRHTGTWLEDGLDLFKTTYSRLRSLLSLTLFSVSATILVVAIVLGAQYARG